jgi:hypothetical protein
LYLLPPSYHIPARTSSPDGAHAAPQKSARLDEPGANGMTMRKKHESAGKVLNMPQAARSLHPKCPPRKRFR